MSARSPLPILRNLSASMHVPQRNITMGIEGTNGIEPGIVLWV